MYTPTKKKYLNIDCLSAFIYYNIVASVYTHSIDAFTVCVLYSVCCAPEYKMHIVSRYTVLVKVSVSEHRDKSIEVSNH